MPQDFQSLNEFMPMETTERNLPHWQQQGCTYFITWRMADSVPEEVLRPWRDEREAFFLAHPQPWDSATQRAYHQLFTRRMEEWLDAGYGSCALREPSLRDPVRECLHYFHPARYVLNSWVIMPNHVHVIVRPHPDWALSRILHTWKSFTATQINKLRQTSGTFWMDESFDHIVRSLPQLDHFRHYIKENPLKARLRPDEYSLWMGDDNVPPPLLK